MRHVIASATKQSIFLALSLVLTVFTACDSSSSSADPDPVAEISSSSGDDDDISSSSVSDKGKSSGGSSKSSSSVKSGDDSQMSSSSVSGKKNNSSSSDGEGNLSSSINDAHSSSSSRYKTCTAEKEGIEAYISQEESWCICTNGFWIPVSSSSTEPSSSSKYYDMSRLFVNEKGYSYGEFTDPRDGQVYKTISYKLGYEVLDSITYFAQNLNYGKMILGGTQMTDSTKFCYDDDPWYCENGFGGLYTWATVMNFPAACDSFAIGSAECPVEYDLMRSKTPYFRNKFGYVMHQGICPEGWHVMNREEWVMVMDGSGSRNGANYLGAVLWGSNQRGFSLLPAGILETQWATSSNEKIVYADMKNYALHWIPGEYGGETNVDPNASYGNCVTVASDRINRTAGAKKVFGLSIRCTKDY